MPTTAIDRRANANEQASALSGNQAVGGAGGLAQTSSGYTGGGGGGPLGPGYTPTGGAGGGGTGGYYGSSPGQPYPGFDQPPGHDQVLPQWMPAVAVAQSAGLAVEIKRLPRLGTGDEFDGPFLKAPH